MSEVRSFVEQCVESVQDTHGEDASLVVIFDSVERLRGTSLNEHEVQASIENLFGGHPDKLRFDYVHTVYTVPPWLKVRSPGIGGLYSGLCEYTCVKTRARDGQVHQPGLDRMADLVGRRGDWERLLGSRDVMDDLALRSGGYIRDLLRLVAQVALDVASLPASDQLVAGAVGRIRNGYLPLADDEVRWLHRIAQTKDAGLLRSDQLGQLAQFFDTHLVLTYQNDAEWYDVHPLLADLVAERGAELAADSGNGRDDGDNGEG